MLAEFLTLLYFITITRDGADIIGWRPARARARLFEVKSFYKILHTMVSFFYFYFYLFIYLFIFPLE
jgi:hypothetical protein